MAQRGVLKCSRGRGSKQSMGFRRKSRAQDWGNFSVFTAFLIQGAWHLERPEPEALAENTHPEPEALLGQGKPDGEAECNCPGGQSQ